MGFDDRISTWLQLSDFACLFFNNLFSYFHKVKVRISVCVCFNFCQFHAVVALNSFQTWPCQIYSKFLYTLDIITIVVLISFPLIRIISVLLLQVSEMLACLVVFHKSEWK